MKATLDARTLREAMSRYLEALEAHREEIDSLNVFPVPDGDTGTNMLLTQRAVVEALDGSADGSLGEPGRTIARAALMGARGNSGVILSQILRGFCERYEDAHASDGRALAQALANADREARKAVARPVEGTILSVLHEAAEAAAAAAADDPSAVCEAALEAAKDALARTTDALPDLKKAGVVDAGAKGLVLLLDALVAAVKGVPLSVEVGPLGPVGHPERPAQHETRYGFEVMYLLEGPELDVPMLKHRLTEIGDSVVVVGGGDLLNVHVHTDDAGTAVEAGVAVGRPREIRITSLDAQVAEHCVAEDGFREVGVADEPRPPPEGAPGIGEIAGDQSIVAVVEGAGLEEIFRSLGAIVVRGGPGNNPSVGDLVAAIERAPTDLVHVLANHKNVVPAAEAAATEVSKTVHVARARTVPEGIAAALSLGDADFASVSAAMLAAVGETCSGEIAWAERQAEWSGGRIEPGDCLGMSAGEIRVVGSDPADVAVRLVGTLGPRPEGSPSDPGRPVACNELITLYVGADADDEEGERVATALREAFPHLEVEVRRGHQPRYPYLIGIE